jgi:hypothetical protein
VQAREGSARRGGVGRAPGEATEASFLVAVNLDVAFAGSASVRAGGVGEEYVLGVQGLVPTGALAVAYPSDSALDPFSTTPQPPFTVPWGATGAGKVRIFYFRQKRQGQPLAYREYPRPRIVTTSYNVVSS